MTTRTRFAAGRRTAPTEMAEPQTTPAEGTAPRTAPTATGERWVGPVTQRLRTEEAGMATAEYAVATLAACGFAGLLVAVLSSGEVQEMLLSIVRRALTLE